jgi:hypothetical protein
MKAEVTCSNTSRGIATEVGQRTSHVRFPLPLSYETRSLSNTFG